MERYIYYCGQQNWEPDNYDYLNSFLNKIFQYRNKPINKYRIEHMNLYAMEDTTKAILKAVLDQQEIMDDIIEEYPNLRDIKNQKPLKEPLKITNFPCGCFEEYNRMNLIF